VADPFPPRAYLIGAQKAGTTTLAALLGGHPGIAVARPKEPDFFTGNFERGLTWYRARFAHAAPGALLLDASTSYTMAPLDPAPGSRMDKVPERIAACRPDALFIYVLREPAERAWSAYWHAVRAGWEKDGFARALRPDSLYVRASRYGHQLARFTDRFARERILLLDFGDLRPDPVGAAARCVRFLGLPPAPAGDLAPRHDNRSFVFNPLGRALTGVLGGPAGLKRLNRALGRHLPAPLRRAARRALTTDVPPLDPASRARLEALLAEELMAWRQLVAGPRAAAGQNLLGAGG
jgi:hypothetical protein